MHPRPHSGLRGETLPRFLPPGPTRIRKKKLNRQRAASRCSRAFRHLGFTNQTFKKKRNIQNLSRIDPKTNKDSTKNRSKFNPRSFQGWSNYQEKTSKKHLKPILNRSKKRPKFNQNSTQMVPGSASGRVLEAGRRNGERVFEKKVPI